MPRRGKWVWKKLSVKSLFNEKKTNLLLAVNHFDSYFMLQYFSTMSISLTKRPQAFRKARSWSEGPRRGCRLAPRDFDGGRGGGTPPTGSLLGKRQNNGNVWNNCKIETNITPPKNTNVGIDFRTLDTNQHLSFRIVIETGIKNNKIENSMTPAD